MNLARTVSLRNTVLALALLLGVIASVAAKPSNKWRIEVNHSADSEGEIVFLVSPEGGTPVEVVTHVKDNTNENRVALAMVKAFKAQLDGDLYHIERDDWEDVLVKKRRGAANFDLTLVSSSVEGVSLKLERE